MLSDIFPDRKDLEAYIRKTADLMDLRDWRIELNDDHPDDDCGATVQVLENRRLAKVSVSEGTETPENLRHYIVHELVHLHLWPIDQSTESIIGALGSTSYSVFSMSHRNAVEQAVDAVACVISPHLPLPNADDQETDFVRGFHEGYIEGYRESDKASDYRMTLLEEQAEEIERLKKELAKEREDRLAQAFKAPTVTFSDPVKIKSFPTGPFPSGVVREMKVEPLGPDRRPVLIEHDTGALTKLDTVRSVTFSGALQVDIEYEEPKLFSPVRREISGTIEVGTNIFSAIRGDYGTVDWGTGGADGDA